MMSKIKHRRQRIPVWQSRSFIPQLIKKGMSTPIQRFNTPFRIIRQGRSYEIHGIIGSFRSEYLAPLTGLDLGEFELGVVGIHGADFFSGGRAEHLDDFDELVDA